ncbi:MAG: hypothetical protein WBN23_10660, partial [Woeseia sp.]
MNDTSAHPAVSLRTSVVGLPASFGIAADRRGNRYELLNGIVAICDMAIVCIFGMLAASIFVESLAGRLASYVIVTGLSALALVTTFRLLRLYSIRS